MQRTIFKYLPSCDCHDRSAHSVSETVLTLTLGTLSSTFFAASVKTVCSSCDQPGGRAITTSMNVNCDMPPLPPKCPKRADLGPLNRWSVNAPKKSVAKSWGGFPSELCVDPSSSLIFQLLTIHLGLKLCLDCMFSASWPQCISVPISLYIREVGRVLRYDCR